jgi:thiazole synthase
MGADCVLVNTAIAAAADPVKMALAFSKAVEAAELARQAGPRAPRMMADASSPLTGFLWKE